MASSAPEAVRPPPSPVPQTPASGAGKQPRSSLDNTQSSGWSTGSKKIDSHIEASGTPWTDEERNRYLESLSLAKLPGEEALWELLEAALADAPLVRPWSMKRDSKGRAYFINSGTGKSQWRHPIEPSLRELAGVCRPFLLLPLERRKDPVLEVKHSWEREVAKELGKWCVAQDKKGREYYYHEETEASTWEHPSVSLLPTLYVKTRALERLIQEDEPTTVVVATAAGGPRLVSKGTSFFDEHGVEQTGAQRSPNSTQPLAPPLPALEPVPLVMQMSGGGRPPQSPSTQAELPAERRQYSMQQQPLNSSIHSQAELPMDRRQLSMQQQPLNSSINSQAQKDRWSQSDPMPLPGEIFERRPSATERSPTNAQATQERELSLPRLRETAGGGRPGASTPASKSAAMTMSHIALPEPPTFPPLPWSGIRRWESTDTEEMHTIIRAVSKSSVGASTAPPGLLSRQPGYSGAEDMFKSELMRVLAAPPGVPLRMPPSGPSMAPLRSRANLAA